MKFVLRVPGDGRMLWVRCEANMWTLVAHEALATRWTSMSDALQALETAPGPIRVGAQWEEVDG
jgi:hypothetical protein